MIKSWLFEFFHQPLDPSAAVRSPGGARTLPLVRRTVGTGGCTQLRGHLLQRAPLRRRLQPITEPADVARRCTHDRLRLGVLGIRHSVRDAVADRRGDRHARSPHQRPVRDRRRQRNPAGARRRRHHTGCRCGPPHRDHRRARRGVEEPRDLAPRRALELRRPRDPAPMPAAAISTGVDRCAHRGVGRARRSARVEGMRRVPLGEGNRRRVRLVPAGRRGGGASLTGPNRSPFAG